jgi:hypothetical protein
MLNLFAFSRYCFDHEKKVLALLNRLASGPFPPTHFDVAEPVRRKLDPARRSQAARILSGVPEHTGGSLFLKSKHPPSTFIYRWAPGIIAEWYGEMDDGVIAHKGGRKELIHFITSLFCEFPCVFAGVAPAEDWKAKHWIVEEDGNGKLIKKTGLDLERSIPGVYWMSIFGAELVAHFGRGTLSSVPDCEVIDLGDAGVALVLTIDPDRERQTQRAAREERIIRALGLEYFFDISKPNRLCTRIAGVTEPPEGIDSLSRRWQNR